MTSETQGADGAGTKTAGAEWPDSSPNPTPEELASPQFGAIWQVIKSWDIGIPEEYGGYCGATGSHVVRILRALSAVTPAPAAMPGVPDSVREALGRLSRAVETLNGSQLWLDDNSPWRIMLKRGRFNAAVAEAHPESAKGDGEWNDGATICAIVNEAIKLAAAISAHPAGQSTGQGAEEDAEQRITNLANALASARRQRGEQERRAITAEQRIIELEQGKIHPALAVDVQEHRNQAYQGGWDDGYAEGHGKATADANKPAPDSTRTGPVGTEDFREEVAYWRRDLSARLLSMTALYKAALERGEGARAADLANALRSALASYHNAEDGEWHDRCELCGEFVRDGEARAAWEDVSGHARCLSEDEKGHVDPHGDEDLAQRAEEAQAALDSPWPEAALAARPAAPEAQGAVRQPIETAPKDRSEILLFGTLARSLAKPSWFIGAWFPTGEHGDGWWVSSCVEVNATEWAPLPAPPASSGQEGA